MIRMGYDNTAQQGDLDRTGNKNFIDDLDLETAALISLFTERRVQPGDDGDGTLDYKGGYWADATNDDGDLIGSRLWLLKRKKATLANVNLAATYIRECFQWMIDDGVTNQIDVETWRGDKPVDLRFMTRIHRPGGANPWEKTWEIQLDEL